MRAELLGLAVLVAVAIGAQANDLPDPPGCAGYHDNKTGSDPDCDLEIAKETEPAAKSVLLYRRAYMVIDRADFGTYPKALSDLDEAIRLLPTNYFALHERGYIYNEYRRWAEAEADLDKAIMLVPQVVDNYRERAMSRLYLGDLEGRYEDRNTEVILLPQKLRPLIERAAAAIWLGKFDDAVKDLNVASTLGTVTQKETDEIKAWRELIVQMQETSGPDGATACVKVNKDSDYSGKKLVGDCTRAFLNARTGKDKAAALTIRAIAFQNAGNEDDARVDYAVAVAFDPDNGSRHSNLGFALIGHPPPRGAVDEFDRAIALKPTYVAYAGRASAKYRLHDLDGAFADAKKSFEMKPNYLALWVVGDVVYERTKSCEEAKKFWVGAYQLGSRDDRLIERLKNAGVPIPPPETDEKLSIP